MTIWVNETFKLEESIWKERKKEKDWGKKGILLQVGEGKTIMVFFTSLRPNSKRKGRGKGG